MAITPQQFKDMMLATGKVKNQQVTEPVLYGIPGPVNIPSNMEIINCEIPELNIANATMNEIKIRDGKIGKVHLNTNSNYTKVVINNCEIIDLQLEEAFIQNIRIISNYATKIAGRYTSVGTLRLEGNLDSFFHNGLNGQELIVIDCTLNSIQLIDGQVSEVKIKNTTCPGISLGFGSGVPARMELTNVTTKEASLTYSYVRRVLFDTQDAQSTIPSLIFKQ